MKYARKVISLLLAMVMALSLTTGVWAENENGGGKSLAETLGITNTDAADYVNQYFTLSDNGEFVFMKDVNYRGDQFFVTNSDKATAQDVVNQYAGSIKTTLDAKVIPYGNANNMTFGTLLYMYRESLAYPVIKTSDTNNEPDTGSVNFTDLSGLNKGNRDYLNSAYHNNADAVTRAVNYFNTYFDYREGSFEGNQATENYYTVNLKQNADEEDAINAYGSLPAASVVILNELDIKVLMQDDSGNSWLERFRFWRYMDMLAARGEFDPNNQSGGGNQSGGVNRPSTGENGIDDLTGQAKTYVDQYISYDYNKNNNVTIVRFNGATIDDKTGLYANEDARKAAIDAYNAYMALDNNAKGALEDLYVTDDKGEPCWFSDRVETLFALAKNQTSGTPAGSISDADAKLNDDFRKAGYKAPTLGVDFRLEFPDALALGRDYDYTYNSTTGHLIITVKTPTEDARERWLQAAAESYADGLVLCQFYCDNVMGKQLSSSWCGNGNEGWTPYLNGNINFEGRGSSQVGNGMAMAIFNTVDDVRGVSSVEDDGVYRFVTVWANDGEIFSAMDKYVLTFEVKTESPFYFEEEGIEIIDKVNLSRVHLIYDTSVPSDCFTERRNEIGTLTLQKKQPYTGNSIGTFTVDAPEGYTLDRWEEGNSGNSGNGTSIPLNNRESNFYQFIWTDGKGGFIKEELTIYVAEMGFEALGSYDEDGAPLSSNSVPVNKPSNGQVNSPNNTTITVSYDQSSGFFYTSFNSTKLPSYQELNAGVSLTPDGLTGVTHFRVNDQVSNDYPGRSDAEIKKIVAALYTAEDVYALNDPNSAQKLIFPYVHTNYKNVNGVNVSYAGSQAYRFKIVQWLHYDKVTNSYEVLGYSYVSGRNDAFISKTVTNSVSAPMENSEAPFIIGSDMEFCCNRYPQMEGDDEVQYFRFHVRGEGMNDQSSYKVYIPYAYFDMTKEVGLARAARGEKPVIYHYYGNHELREGTDGRFDGQYTEYGVYFEVTDFSPFVVDCSAASNSGSTGGGSSHRVTTAVKADSPATFDAGIALYGALAISSLTGMGYVAKKKF